MQVFSPRRATHLFVAVLMLTIAVAVVAKDAAAAPAGSPAAPPTSPSAAIGSGPASGANSPPPTFAEPFTEKAAEKAAEKDTDNRSDQLAEQHSAASPVHERPTAEAAKLDGAKTDAPKAREGSEWKGQRGRFTLVGDRVSFTPSDRQLNIMVLENLNLERIVRTIEESRTVTDADQLEWTIDGQLTEYRGSNFLLLQRSVLVAKPKKPDSVR
jgi:hypothetical protein